MTKSAALLLASVLAFVQPVEGQLRSPWAVTWTAGWVGGSSETLHEDRFRVSYSRGMLVGVRGTRELGGPVGLQLAGTVVLGSTLVIRDTEPPCADLGPSQRSAWCRSQGSPRLGVLRITGGPAIRLGALELSGGGGFALDLGDFAGQACALADAACLALLDFPWPGAGGVLTAGATGRWNVGDREVTLGVEESRLRRSGHSFRQRVLTVGLVR